MLSSKGAAGITGAGFITLAATLSVVPSVPVAGMALILGIDRFMSECRALTNFVGNAVATVVVARWENELDQTKFAAAMAGKLPLEPVDGVPALQAAGIAHRCKAPENNGKPALSPERGFSCIGGLPGEIQAVQSVEVVDVLCGRRVIEPEAGQPLEEDRQDDVQFQSRQRRPDAEMDARAKGEVGSLVPIRLEGQGIAVFRRVEIGRGQNEAHLVAALERNAVDLDRLQRPTLEDVNRRADTQATLPPFVRWSPRP